MLGKNKQMGGKGLVDQAMFKLEFKNYMMEKSMADGIFKLLPDADKQLLRKTLSSHSAFSEFYRSDNLSFMSTMSPAGRKVSKMLEETVCGSFVFACL